MDLEALQEGVCLALAVPGATLEVRCQSEEMLCVSNEPTADLSIAQLRRAVLAALDPELTDCSRWIASIELAGSLTPRAHGVYERVTSDQAERWFATLEAPQTAAARFRTMDAPHLDGVLVSIHPDRLLGAAAVRIRSSDPAHDLDDVACVLAHSLGTHLHEAPLAS